MPISRIRIIGLFEGEDITFDLSISPVFLVGPNGVGKTTALKILFCMLTAQWPRLRQFPFVGLELSHLDDTAFVDRDDIRHINTLRTALGFIGRRARGMQVWPDTWADALKIMSGRPSFRRMSTQRVEDLSRLYEPLATINNFVERESKGRVLYFPTYRRVERDLGELIGTLDDDEDDDFAAGELAEAVETRFREFGEVIGFGGQDIRRLITAAAERVEQAATKALNEHSIRFLDTLASPEQVDTRGVRNFIRDEQNIAEMLRRIQALSVEGFDAEPVAKRLRTLSDRLKKQSWGRLKQQDDMLLYYVGTLISLFTTIDELSAALRLFNDLINKYLSPVKRSVLDPSTNSISIFDRRGHEIDFDELSSGEKQILAFFAFLVLSDRPGDIFIILDEPELSLSVSWQKSLVADLTAARSCRYIAVATHSPFIIDRFPLDKVVSLEAGL